MRTLFAPPSRDFIHTDTRLCEKVATVDLPRYYTPCVFLAELGFGDQPNEKKLPSIVSQEWHCGVSAGGSQHRAHLSADRGPQSHDMMRTAFESGFAKVLGARLGKILTLTKP